MVARVDTLLQSSLSGCCLCLSLSGKLMLSGPIGPLRNCLGLPVGVMVKLLF